MRRFLTPLLTVALVGSLAAPATARDAWKQRIDRLAAGHTVSISVRDGDEVLYRWNPSARRTPASVQKMLMTLALMDRVPADLRIATLAEVEATTTEGGVVRGDLWLVGRGDPSITGGGAFGKSLPFKPTRLSELADEIAEAGITAIKGSVRGAVSYFAHDWWAPGWKHNFPDDYVALPSALTFEGNKSKGRHIADPEVRAARSLTKRLRALDITVGGKAGAGSPPPLLSTVARVTSEPLVKLLRYTNRQSSNFFSEVLGKRLAVESGASPGTIAGGATAIERFAERYGVSLRAHDSSGLSYSNRVAPAGVTRLLGWAEGQTWFAALRSTLAGAGQGTLDDRLNGVKLRAKTGTLDHISTLAGYVWLRRSQSWGSFSIMSSGMLKTSAAALEDGVVREITRSAR